jgi:hypothetical protein
MLPQNTDLFTPNDFTQTFAKLDSIPGVTAVSNYASLPANLTQAQHGSKYTQLDNGASWYWNQPTSSPGAWTRANALGVLAQTWVPQEIDITTAYGYIPSGAPTTFPNPTIASASGVSPGGRWIGVFVSIESAYCPAYRAPAASLYQGSTLLTSTHGQNFSTRYGVTLNLISWVPPMPAGTPYTFTLQGWVDDTSPTFVAFTGTLLTVVEV